MSSPRLLSSSLVGAVDQGLLSIFNLAIGVAFIKFSSKVEYADYTLATNALLLFQSVQAAAVNSPIITLASGATDPRHLAAVQCVGHLVQRRFVAGLAVSSLFVASLAHAADHTDWAWLLLSCGVAAMGMLLREYRRAQQFLRGDPWGALLADATYVAIAGTGIAALSWLAGHVSAVTVLTMVGVAGVLAGIASRRDRQPTATGASSNDELRAARQAIWSCAKWALPSVVNSWLYANAFLFLVERLISKDAVADLSASRLLLVPLSLLVVGWSAAFRPRAGRWLVAGDVDQIHRVAVRSAVAFALGGIAYGGLLFLLLPLLQQGLLGAKYRSVGSLAPVWLLFFSVTAVRTVGMSAMLTHATAFKTLYHYGWVALAVALAGVWATASRGSLSGVVFALVLAELALLILVWWRGWPAIRRGDVGAIQ